jgi:alpha-tubulin suppressor-like RCC1 family protein
MKTMNRFSKALLVAFAALGAASTVACGSAPPAEPEATEASSEALISRPNCGWYEYVECSNEGPRGQTLCYCMASDPGGPTVTEIALGQSTGYALGYGSIYTWGSGAHYARGDGYTNDVSILQEPLSKPGRNPRFPQNYEATHITAGDTGAAALLTNGSVIAWGTVAPGVDWPTPSGIAGLTVDTTKTDQLAHGANHACAIAVPAFAGGYGQTYCWGANDQGQLGDGTTTNRTTIAPIAAMGSCDGMSEPVPPLTALAAGGATTCGLGVDGNVWCWGDNTHGALGQGTESPGIPSTIPLCVHPTFSSSPAASWIRGGGSGTFCIGTDNVTEHMECWGNNTLGQVGDGMPIPRKVPTEALKTMLDAPVLSFGTSHTCYGGTSPALSTSASTVCFGDDTWGQLGDGTTSTTPRYSPVSPKFDQFTRVAAGGTFSCGIPTSGGFLKCWGKDDHGQVPDGAAIAAPGTAPPVVTTPTNAVWWD